MVGRKAPRRGASKDRAAYPPDLCSSIFSATTDDELVNTTGGCPVIAPIGAITDATGLPASPAPVEAQHSARIFLPLTILGEVEGDDHDV